MLSKRFHGVVVVDVDAYVEREIRMKGGGVKDRSQPPQFRGIGRARQDQEGWKCFKFGRVFG